MTVEIFRNLRGAGRIRDTCNLKGEKDRPTTETFFWIFLKKKKTEEGFSQRENMKRGRKQPAGSEKDGKKNETVNQTVFRRFSAMTDAHRVA